MDRGPRVLAAAPVAAALDHVQSTRGAANKLAQSEGDHADRNHGLNSDPVGRHYVRRCIDLRHNPHYPVLHGAPEEHCYALDGLQLYCGGEEPLDEILGGSGGIFLRTLHLGDVRRLVMPFTDSGIYPSLARSTAFAGEIVLNEPDPGLARVLQRLLHEPEAMIDGVAEILRQLHALCLDHGLMLDDNFRFTWSPATHPNRNRMKVLRDAVRKLLQSPLLPVPANPSAIWPNAEDVDRPSCHPIAKHKDAALWFAQDRRSHVRRAVKATTGELLFPHVSLYIAPLLKQHGTVALLRKKVHFRQIRSRLRTLSKLYTQPLARTADPLVNKISCQPSMDVLGQASEGDFVVLNTGFGRFPANGPHARAALAPPFRQNVHRAWARGARILLVRRAGDPGLTAQLEAWGLRVTRQPANSGAASCSFGPHSRVFLVATNFETSEGKRALFPLPATGSSPPPGWPLGENRHAVGRDHAVPLIQHE
jgi:hypothetical protein